MSKKLKIDWSTLYVFYIVVQKGSVLKAAEFLDIHVTTIRRRLYEMESQLRLTLQIKGEKSLKLTSEGERVYSIACQLVELGRELERDTTDIVRNIEGIVRLSTMEGFGSHYIAPRLAELVELYPQLKIELISSQTALNLFERETDISLNMMKPRSGRLVTRHAGKFGVGLYASQEYLDKRGHPESVSDLQGFDFVSYVDDLVPILNVRWLNDIIKNPNLTISCSSLTAQQEAAAAGAGLIVCPHFMVKPSHSLVRILSDEVNLIRDWWLVTHRELLRTPRIRVASDFIVSVMERDRHILMGE